MKSIVLRESEGKTNLNKLPTRSRQRKITDEIAEEIGVHPMLVRKIVSKACYEIGASMNKKHKEVIIHGFGKFIYNRKNRARQAYIEKQNEINNNNSL